MEGGFPSLGGFIDGFQMIEYRTGDLFSEKHPFIAHGCNAHGIMGGGFALLIKNRYPEAFLRYQDICKLRDPIDCLGYVRTVPCKEPDGIGVTTILNCITQLNYGNDGRRYVSYDAVDDCMKLVGNNFQMKDCFGNRRHAFNDDYIAMPKIGTGLGGGEWSIIEAIINHRLKDVKVVVYTL